MKRFIMSALAVAGFSMVSFFASAAEVSSETQMCITCHEAQNKAVVKQWETSKHAENDIGCYECHKAEEGEKDAMNHYGNFVISAIVSPKDCGTCHENESATMQNSHHATANKFTGSLDNVIGRIVTGEANFNLGCAQCHGSNIEVDEKGHPTAPSWPNNGIGRVNPDGTAGTCTGCHNRHSFDIAQARIPETCGKCHQGPDHPQYEIYTLSKHGIQFKAMEDEIDLSGDFVLGKDYYQAPNCVTCHMGATENGLESTHNVGARIKWTLRPPISKVLDAEYGLPDGEGRREEMKKVCINCHQEPFYEQFFEMFDDYVDLYNNKFAIPATDMMKKLKEIGAVDPSPFTEQVEWDYWHLWHHEGRRGRHGAAMQAPDWSHWHGIYEVAYNFYFHMIPAANEEVEKELKAGNITEEQAKEWETFRDEILSRREHMWINGLSKEEREKIASFYQNRYGKEGGQ